MYLFQQIALMMSGEGFFVGGGTSLDGFHIDVPLEINCSHLDDRLTFLLVPSLGFRCIVCCVLSAPDSVCRATSFAVDFF